MVFVMAPGKLIHRSLNYWGKDNDHAGRLTRQTVSASRTVCWKCCRSRPDPPSRNDVERIAETSPGPCEEAMRAGYLRPLAFCSSSDSASFSRNESVSRKSAPMKS